MKMESLAVKDTFFSRLVNQVEFLILVNTGEVKQALNKGYEIINFAKKYQHDDVELAEFKGIFGEFLYNIDKNEQAVDYIREGRVSYWLKCRSNGLELIPVDINQNSNVQLNADRKKVTEDVLQQFATSAASQAAAKGGAKPDPKKVAPPAKGGAQPTSVEDLP